MKVKDLSHPPISSSKVPPHLKSRTRLTGLILSALAAIVSTLNPASTEAQTNLTMKPIQVRVEVPVGFNSSYFITNCNLRVPTNGATGVDGTGTNWIIADVTASISGAPAGVTASLVNSDLTTPVGTIPISMNTNNASKSTNLIVRLDFDGSEAPGVTTLTLKASGGGLPDDTFLLPLEVAKIWNGPGNAAVNGSGNWSDATKWQGGVPGPNDIVVFNDLGAQTNILLSSSTSTNQLTNSIVDTTTTISGLRFSQTNGVGSILTNTHNLGISPGVTLAIKGDAGFKMLRDYTFWTPKMNVSIWGTNGTMVQTNENSDFAILTDGATGGNAFEILDMSRLGNLQLDVNQVNIGNIFGYPNYLQFATNGYNSGSTMGSSRPQKIQPTWNMALTNVVKAVFVDTNNYTNSLDRNYAMLIGHNDLTGGSSGNDQVVSMGASNAFFMDGICIGGFGSLGAVLNFQNTNSFAFFRNTNGGRMTIFTCGDGAGTTSLNAPAGVNTKCGNSGFGVDFTKGTVDILVDKFFMSMDRGLTSGGGGQVQSSLGLSSGTIDANDAFICYQSSGDQTNNNNCVATLTVSTNGVFKVNGTLTLGYTKSDAGDPSAPGNSNGKINIGPGGTVMANNISVGGITKTTGGNNISLSSGASLIVSNNIGDATSGGALGTLSFGGTGNSSLTLFIDGSKPAVPLVYVTNLTASGTGNKLIIGAVTNVTFPVDIPLIAGVSSSFPISPSTFDGGVQMPAGMTGILTLSSSNTINIHIINRTPHHLTWRAPGDTATWDYTSFNWLDTDTGITTNYNNPDIVTFDDTPGHATNVVLGGGSDPLTPLDVNMTNNTVYYTFQDGGNSLLGGPSLNKYGTGTVQVDGNTTLAAQLNQGNLVGAGSIGSANIAAATTLNFTGSIGGSVIDSGVATIGGIVSGTLAVQSGGVVTNSGTINSPFSVKTNGFLYNTSSGSLHNIGAASSGSAQVAAGGILINAGTIGEVGNGDILFVNGTFEDLATTGMTLSSLTVGTGGKFIPGGDGVANTTINSDGNPAGFPGALLLQLGSTTVFKVDPSGPANTTVTAAHLSFGGSSGQQTQNGGILVITNINGAPFSAGQSFKLFISGSGTVFNANTGTSTNTFPTIVPASPGPGLAWDLRHIWVPDSLGHDGVIGVVNANSGPTFTSSYSLTTTNIALQFSWDPTNQGMRLESLVVPWNQGINATNAWTGVAGSQTNTTVNLTNNISTNNVFYRLVFP
jgi:hypothetical protein